MQSFEKFSLYDPTPYMIQQICWTLPEKYYSYRLTYAPVSRIFLWGQSQRHT